MTSPITPDALKVLNLHRAGAEPMPFAFMTNGSPRDMTGVSVVFKVQGGPTIPLARHETLAHVMVLSFTDSDLAAIPPRGADYFIKDEAAGRVIVDGRVFARGFA
ncbi:hypothetical protein [Brevundimonas sp. NPDC058933]|uniref:hypothetical protein n=1 Tax=Brevundimonas sp. NPDC058933 TaxID=3346673 RepID=UPI003BEF3AE9